MFGNSRKTGNNKFKTSLAKTIKAGVYLFLVFLMSFLFFSSRLNPQKKIDDNIVSYSETDKQEMDAVFDEASLYDETADEHIEISRQEELRPELLDPQPEEKEAAVADNEFGFVLTPIPDAEFKAALQEALERDDEQGDDALETAYEETLLENVIMTSPHKDQAEKEYHIKHKDIKKLQVLPADKPLSAEMPKIAIVIDDMGISYRRSKDIISLHAPLTSSFLTYGKKLNEQVAAARSAGHEVMVHTPMEAKSNVDAAPDVLTTQMTPDEIKENLLQMLKKFDDVRGINNHMGSKLTEDSQRMGAVMEVLNEKGLFFLDSKTSPKSVGREAAGKFSVPYVTRNVFLDNENNFEYISKQLALTEKIAARNGYAVAICHPKSQTYLALKAWLEELPRKNFKLVHLSEIVRDVNK